MINQKSNYMKIKKLLERMEIEVANNGNMYFDMVKLKINTGSKSLVLKFPKGYNSDFSLSVGEVLFDPLTNHKHAQFIMSLFITANEDDIEKFEYKPVDSNGNKVYNCYLIGHDDKGIIEILGAKDLKTAMVDMILSFYDNEYADIEESYLVMSPKH